MDPETLRYRTEWTRDANERAFATPADPWKLVDESRNGWRATPTSPISGAADTQWVPAVGGSRAVVRLRTTWRPYAGQPAAGRDRQHIYPGGR